MVNESLFFERLKEKEYDRAIDQLYFESYQGLYQYAYSILNLEEASKDVVQGVFLRIWERRKSFALTENITAYLFKAVFYASMNELKRKKIRVESEKNIKTELYSEGVFHDHSLQYKEVRMRIALVLESLPEGCRQVFSLSRFGGLGRAEIAEKLGLSVRTVDAQLYKAVSRMKAALKEDVS